MISHSPCHTVERSADNAKQYHINENAACHRIHLNDFSLGIFLHAIRLKVKLELSTDNAEQHHVKVLA